MAWEIIDISDDKQLQWFIDTMSPLHDVYKSMTPDSIRKWAKINEHEIWRDMVLGLVIVFSYSPATNKNRIIHLRVPDGLDDNGKAMALKSFCVAGDDYCSRHGQKQRELYAIIPKVGCQTWMSDFYAYVAAHIPGWLVSDSDAKKTTNVLDPAGIVSVIDSAVVPPGDVPK